MPAYDFRCKVCNHVFEITRPSTDDSPVACPECQGETKQVFHPVGVHFKGSGFHNTDYRPKPAGGDCASCPSANPATGSCAAAE